LAGAGTDRADLPTFDGTITAGMTLSRVKIIEGVDLTDLPDVTLDRVWLQPVGADRALILGAGTVIRDSDIDGSRMPEGERWGLYHADTPGAPYSIERVQITGVSIGAWLDGSAAGRLSEAYIHGMESTGRAHLDGITRRAGTGELTIERSRVSVDFGSWATGAFFLQSKDEPIGGITLKDTLLEGDGYVMVLENNGPGTAFAAENLRLRPTEYGAITSTGKITSDRWVDVFLYDPAQPDAAGAEVPHP
jgi:hypothetical protein